MSTPQSFDYQFTVPAPLAAVAAFHHDARILPRLTPPPMRVQLHRVDPLGEGALADFTLWFGPLPVRWVAPWLMPGCPSDAGRGAPTRSR